MAFSCPDFAFVATDTRLHHPEHGTCHDFGGKISRARFGWLSSLGNSHYGGELREAIVASGAEDPAGIESVTTAFHADSLPVLRGTFGEDLDEEFKHWTTAVGIDAEGWPWARLYGRTGSMYSAEGKTRDSAYHWFGWPPGITQEHKQAARAIVENAYEAAWGSPAVALKIAASVLLDTAAASRFVSEDIRVGGVGRDRDGRPVSFYLAAPARDVLASPTPFRDFAVFDRHLQPEAERVALELEPPGWRRVSALYSATTDHLSQGSSRRLTAAAYLDGSDRPARGADGFQFDGDAYIPDTAAPLVGTSGSPSSLTKTLRIAASALVPRDHTETFTFDTTGYLYPGDTTLRSFFGAVALPVGVTITEVAANGYRAGTSDSLIVYFHRRTGDGAYSTLATLTHSTTGWQTVTSSISEGISSSYFYTFRVNLNANTSPADVRFDHIRITYTMPSYDKGI